MAESPPWHEPGRWFSPPVYWSDAVQEDVTNPSREVKIIDSTISEGEDMVGRHFGWTEWLELSERVDEMGVASITDPMGQSEETLGDYLGAVRDRGVTAAISHKLVAATFPLEAHDTSIWERKLEAILEYPFDSITLLGKWPKAAVWSDFDDDAAVSAAQVAADVRSFVGRAVDAVADRGRETELVFGFPYTFQHRLPRLVEFNAAALDAGADGLYLFDSTGQANPSVSRTICSTLKAELDDHTLYAQHHNDLGMATASSLAAAEGGADYIDATVAGIGDRGGTAAIEEVACALEAYGWETGIDLSMLNDVAAYVREAMDFEVAPHRPIIGEQIDVEEGIGHRNLDDPPESPMGIAGELLGRPFHSVIGYNYFTKERGVGVGQIGNFTRMTLEEWGYELDEDEWERLETRLLDQIVARGHISMDEFEAIVESVAGRTE